MHFVVDEMIEFKHVHVADGHLTVEAFSRASVVKFRLTGIRDVRELEQPLDFLLRCTIEYRRGRGDTVSQVARQLEHFGIAERTNILVLTASLVVDELEELADSCNRFLRFQHRIDLSANPFRRHTQVRLKHLADIHP